MLQFVRDVEIQVPPDEVFAKATRVEDWSQWMSFLSEASSVAAQAPAVGTRYALVSNLFGMTMRHDAAIIELSPPQRAVFQSTLPFTGRLILDFIPTETGTRLHVEVEGNPGSLLDSAPPMALTLVENLFASELANLKRWIEGA